MPLLPRLKKLEKEINDKLKDLGLPVYFRIDHYDSKTGALEHTVGYYDLVAKEVPLKVWEVIRKHYESWKKEFSKEF